MDERRRERKRERSKRRNYVEREEGIAAAALPKSKMGGCCCVRVAYFLQGERKEKEKHNQLAIVGKKSIIGAPLLAKPPGKRYIKGTGSHNPKILGPIYTKPQSFLSFSFSSLSPTYSAYDNVRIQDCHPRYADTVCPNSQ